MKAIPFQPSPVLQSLVSTFIVVDIEADPSAAYVAYHYPWTAQAHLNFLWKGTPLTMKIDTENDQYISFPASFVLGPILSTSSVDYINTSAVVTCFRPGALQRLLGIPVSELINKVVEAVCFFGKDIHETEQRIRNTSDHRELIVIVENFYKKQLAKIKSLQPFDQALHELVRSNGTLHIDKVASLACLSQRQFERKCNERLGMSPKLFARLIRFTRAHALKEHNPGLTWTSIAHQVGFYDQMHLIRDFKTFSGNTPSLMANTDSPIKLLSAFETEY